MSGLCDHCGQPARRNRCDKCYRAQSGTSVKNGAAYEPDDAVEGALYLRDPAHDVAVRVSKGDWPKEWLR